MDEEEYQRFCVEFVEPDHLKLWFTIYKNKSVDDLNSLREQSPDQYTRIEQELDFVHRTLNELEDALEKKTLDETSKYAGICTTIGGFWWTSITAAAIGTVSCGYGMLRDWQRSRRKKYVRNCRQKLRDIERNFAYLQDRKKQ